jgi:hypothetical protein
VLYPEPNVFELVVSRSVTARDRVLFVIAARDFVVVARPPVVVFVVLRVTAAREALVVLTVRVVVVRAVDVSFCFLGVVIGAVVVRETILDFVVRGRETVCVVFCLETVAASRTAASATPMPMQHAKISAKTFLILTTITMITKKIDFGQGLI